MAIPRLYLIIIIVFLAGKTFSQDFIISKPRLEVSGNNLIISYDIITQNSSDECYIWVEIEKANGEKIPAKSFSGDVGVNIIPGNNKMIIWNTDKDSIFINDNIIVIVKGEKYKTVPNKSLLILKSAVFPGWGQTIISYGKPWWISGVAFYGTLAGAFIYHKKYTGSYNAYKIEEDPAKRTDLYDQAQKQSDISTAMIYTAATVWAANILWIALRPIKNKPLPHATISMNPVYNLSQNTSQLSIKIKF